MLSRKARQVLLAGNPVASLQAWKVRTSCRCCEGCIQLVLTANAMILLLWCGLPQAAASQQQQ